MTENTTLRTTGRWISFLVNLYRLSDGRYWIDNVHRNKQFIIPAVIAEQLIPLLATYEGYDGEDLDDLQADYNMPEGHRVPDIPRPYRLYIDPAGPEVTIF
jgi:hypothetical protein